MKQRIRSLVFSGDRKTIIISFDKAYDAYGMSIKKIIKHLQKLNTSF